MLISDSVLGQSDRKQDDKEFTVLGMFMTCILQQTLAVNPEKV
jgi:hypothetical protein